MLEQLTDFVINGDVEVAIRQSFGLKCLLWRYSMPVCLGLTLP